ncbi:L,D-transpeptidase family protein [soil metagenome]
MKILPHLFIKRLLFFVIVGLLAVSCKKKDGGGSSWFSFGNEELGNAELIFAVTESPEELNLFNNDSVSKFYFNRKFLPAWSDKKMRESFVEILEEAEHEGLFIEDYHGDRILQLNADVKKLNDREKSEFDVILTDAFLKFGNHLLHGKLDPRELHSIWDTYKSKILISEVLQEAAENKDVETALKQLRPTHPVYSQLMASSKEYKELASNFDAWDMIPPGDMIKHDKEDNRIPEIQNRLKLLGYLENIDPENTANTKDVQEAIEKFQGDNGLQADGIIGDSTIELLNKDYNRRYEQILVNLERWRWYPRDLGDHYIIVNIANFDLHVVKDNDTVHTHRTMVGTEARKTPVFSEEVKYLEFNPTWTIPPTIQNDDVIPGMRKNSNYLASKKINVYDSGGNAVNPSRINWSGDEAKSYTYRQNPGSSNPLGQVKIMYPNEYFIYLHDTPSQALFERNSRDQSSGCVRVEHVVDLAKYLISDQPEYSSGKIDEIIASGKTTQIKLKQKVNVHHFYWTAWRENGTARFTADIYNYDGKIFEALRKVI